MKSVRVEDCGDCGDFVADDPIESAEYPPSLTIFRNPVGLLAVFASGTVFYSALAYAIWRFIH
jgi:hypothetical protein